MSRTARYSFMGTRGLRLRGVRVFRTNLVGTLNRAVLGTLIYTPWRA